MFEKSTSPIKFDAPFALEGVVVCETLGEFQKKVGHTFLFSYSENPETLRKTLPRDVGVVVTKEYAEEGRYFENVYLVYCRRGLVYVYQVN